VYKRYRHLPITLHGRLVYNFSEKVFLILSKGICSFQISNSGSCEDYSRLANRSMDKEVPEGDLFYGIWGSQNILSGILE